MTPPDDVSTRLSEIRERVEAATEGPWTPEHDYVSAMLDEGRPNGEIIGRFRATAVKFRDEHRDRLNAEFAAHARSDVPYLLSLVEEVRDQLCKYTCECGPASNPDPKEHADYCLYRSALRDAAQEGAE